MKILMVCLGNICRSPLAEGLMAKQLKDLGLEAFVDSAGTGAWHAGESPDQRSVNVANKYGIDISYQRARKVQMDDFSRFDYIFAMDSQNYADLLELADEEGKSRVHLFLEFAGMGKNNVPDPWYGDNQAFEDVYHLLKDAVEKASKKLLTESGKG